MLKIFKILLKIFQGKLMYKNDFPFFSNSDFIYLDNAATTQKPQTVINASSDYYSNYCANTHRSSFGAANIATQKFEDTRKALKEFINAKNDSEIIFTKGVTESINFIAQSYAKKFDTIIISSLEHHSNIVPWHMQNRSLKKGLKVVACDGNLNFDYSHFEELLKNHKNAFVSITHISNAFGKIHDIKRITALAHKYNALIMIDAAQSLAHANIDIQDINCDFFVMSAHKTFGPTGVGAVYIKEVLLKEVAPYQTGGATIHKVTYNESTLLDSPYVYEAGTQNIAGIIAFHEALKYLKNLDFQAVLKEEERLYEYLHQELLNVPGILLYNDTKEAIASKSFNIENIVHDDIGILLDKMKIAVRVGHHCAQPIMDKLGIIGTIRVSLAFYNDKKDIDLFIKALKKAINMLKD